MSISARLLVAIACLPVSPRSNFASHKTPTTTTQLKKDYQEHKITHREELFCSG
jgi:hypothetical protein